MDPDGSQLGIMKTGDALRRADQYGLDLVEISPTAKPPLCKIMDYGKYLYQQKRKLRDAHKKHHYHTTTLKEIRLRPETDQHDLEIKVNHARELLEKGGGCNLIGE